MATEHLLDHVIWNALSTTQSHLAVGGALARRFDPRFALFAGMPRLDAEGFAALAATVAAGEVVGMFEAQAVAPGPSFDVLETKGIVQMIGPATGAIANPARFVMLTAEDVPQMTDLAQRTAPGPWFARTAELGRFHGFKAEGRLVAMAGERMRVPGHTEISAVCCDPAWRGRGLAADLMRLVSQGIVARGERPFLHVLPENAAAISVYERLGFTRRYEAVLSVLRRT